MLIMQLTNVVFIDNPELSFNVKIKNREVKITDFKSFLQY